MKTISRLPILFIFFSMFACANPSEVQKQETARFIVAFNSPALFTAAEPKRDSIIAKWEKLSNSHITFVKTLSGHSWVVSATTPSKASFIEKLQALDDIKYVEEDQIIQVSPIERPGAIRVH